MISGNQESGIWIDQGTSNNQVLGNYIGTDATGTAALGNNWGITLNNSQGNIIGGADGASNLINRFALRVPNVWPILYLETGRG